MADSTSETEVLATDVEAEDKLIASEFLTSNYFEYELGSRLDADYLLLRNQDEEQLQESMKRVLAMHGVHAMQLAFCCMLLWERKFSQNPKLKLIKFYEELEKEFGISERNSSRYLDACALFLLLV